MPAGISRRELIRRFRALGFDGPLSGKRHQFMQQDRLKVRIPNPHQGDIGRELLARILRQGGIDRESWEPT